MKDIINLNAKETNIAIVWAVLFVLFFCVKIETEVSNINMMPIYVQVPLVFMHWFWVGDMFAPLKRKCPFIMTLIAIFGRVVRYSFVLIFLCELKYPSTVGTTNLITAKTNTAIIIKTNKKYFFISLSTINLLVIQNSHRRRQRWHIRRWSSTTSFS